MSGNEALGFIIWIIVPFLEAHARRLNAAELLDEQEDLPHYFSLFARLVERLEYFKGKLILALHTLAFDSVTQRTPQCRPFHLPLDKIILRSLLHCPDGCDLVIKPGHDNDGYFTDMRG